MHVGVWYMGSRAIELIDANPKDSAARAQRMA